MRFLLILFVLALNLQAIYGQNANLTGTVNSSSGEPADMGTVLLKSAADSSFIKGATIEENGRFEISNLNAGSYFVEASHLSYGQAVSAVFTLKDGETLDIPKLSLSSTSVDLNEVTITGRRPMIEVKADKTVLNVENTINATGSDAFELLRKSPGVTIDNSDNIALKGSQGVRILIDGKPSPMDGKDLAAYLKTLPSSQINSIEIISNPSAKFDAAGTAGLINIKLRKNPNLGTNGNVSAGAAWGIHPKGNAAISINHRNAKIGLFSNYSFNAGKNESWMSLYRIQNGLTYDQMTYFVDEGPIHNFKAGADWFLHSKHTLGVLINGNIASTDRNNHASTPISNTANDSLLQILKSRNVQEAGRTNLTSNINYKYSGSKGAELTIDADYGYYRNDNVSYQPNQYYSPDESVIYSEVNFRNKTKVDIDMWVGKADYSQPLWMGKLEAGLKSTFIRTANDFGFYNVVGGQDVYDPDRSNTFEYTENVNAAYVSYNRQFTNWGFMLGLRAEQTSSVGDLQSVTPQPEDYVERQYLDFFPSASLSYQLNQMNQFGLNYSRRIDRPNYQDLNPFESRIDEITYQKGNAFLQPQYTHSIELTHTFAYMYTTSLSFKHTDSYFTEISDTTQIIRNFLTTRNLASQDVVGLNLSCPLQIKPWWSGFLSLGGSYLTNVANFGEGRTIDIEVWSYNVYMQHSFTLPAGFRFETDGFYSSPSIWGGTYKNRYFWGINCGVSKSFAKDKGTIKLTLSDIFHSMEWQGISDFAGAYVVATGGWESRMVRLDVSYRFGNNQLKLRNRKSGAEEESGRIKK